MRPALILMFLAACGGDDSSTPPDAAPATPMANPARGIADTKLAFDVTALTGTAPLTCEPSTTPGATLEVGDLVLDTVSVPFQANTPAKTIDLGLDASDAPVTVDVAFHYKNH